MYIEITRRKINEFIVENWDIFITNLDVVVTIFGFFITYKLTTKTFSNEIRKSKIDHNVEAIHSMPLELCNIMSKIQQSKGSKNAVSASEYEKLMTKIFAYCNKDSVAIAVKIQQTFYKINKTNEDYG